MRDHPADLLFQMLYLRSLQNLHAGFAFGFDLWGAIASWTKETFGFRSAEYTQTAVPSSKKEIPAPLTSIANEMEMHGIPTTILPSYLPDGFVERDFQYNAVTQPESLYCLLENGDSSITLLYTVFSENQDHLLYEKDTVDPEQYEYNGTVYYIMTNKGVYFAAWTADNIECSIAGVETYASRPKTYFFSNSELS